MYSSIISSELTSNLISLYFILAFIAHVCFAIPSTHVTRVICKIGKTGMVFVYFAEFLFKRAMSMRVYIVSDVSVSASIDIEQCE